jgi:hypothetical protein
VTPAVITRVRNRPRGRVGSTAAQLAVEDQTHLIGAADVEVVADDLLEKHPARHRFVQHLGQGELGLQDRALVAVAGGPIVCGKWVRQPDQPLAQQPVDLIGAEAVADRLHRHRVVDGGEPGVQGGEPDCRLGGLAFGPLVAVEAQLGVVGEVGAELEEERAEIVVDAVNVEVVDQPGGLDDPRIGITVRITAFLGAEHGGLLLCPADEQHALGAGELGQVFVHHVVLALPFGEVDPRQPVVAGEPVHRRTERVGDLRQRRGRSDRQP